LEKHELIKKYR
jgi:hypothetical protein